MVRLITGYVADADILPMELIVLFACSLQSEYCSTVTTTITTSSTPIHPNTHSQKPHPTGVMFQCLIHSTTYVGLVLTAVGMGASHGARIFLLPMFITKSFGLRRLTLNLSTASCICGLLMLVRPFFIGECPASQDSPSQLFRLGYVAPR